MWKHFPEEDLDPGKLAAHMIAWQQQWDYDLVKFMPAGTYGVEDWGCETAYLPVANGTRTVTKPAVTALPRTGRGFEPLDVRKGSYGRQNQALATTAKALGGEVPILQTIFSPLTTARKLSSERLFADMRLAPDALHQALEVITDVTIRFSLDALAMGADGVFFASQISTFRLVQEAEYEIFGSAYDLKIFEALRGKAKFNMLHAHGEDIMFDLLSHYPVEMLNWHDRLTEPTLGEAHARFPHLVVGGINEHGTLLHGSIHDIESEVRNAIRQTGGSRLMVAPGCVLPVAASDERVGAATHTAKTFRH